MSRGVSRVDAVPDLERVPEAGIEASMSLSSPPTGTAGAYDLLLARDPVLRGIAAEHGRPDPFTWEGHAPTADDNFSALLLHVIGQQISTRVAQVIFARLEETVGGRPGPAAVAALGSERLHALGLSHAKAVAIAGLGEMHLAGTLDVDALDDLSDEQVTATLTAARGIGPWTAQMFLIHQLRRPDVLPAGDLGIRQAVARAWDLPAVPSIDEVRDRGTPWSPQRTFAAALLWTSLRPAAVA